MASEFEKYKSAGFYVAKNLLDKNRISQVVSSLATTISAQLEIASPQSLFDKDDIFSLLKALHSHDIERYKKVVGALWRKFDVFQIMHDPSIINFLRERFGWSDFFLPGGQVVLIMAQELKIPGGYFGFVPHQDFPSVQGSLDGVVIWFPLIKVALDNYPLDVIPGSHKLGLRSMVNHGTSTWEVQSNAFQESEFVSVEADIGDVVFMSVFTIHRSSLRGGPGKFRIALSTRFDNGNERSFVQRAYPTAYTRSVHREQYQENFPTQEEVAAIFK